MSRADTAIVILAAGLGTRMKSATPKVLHRIFDRTMLSYVIEATDGLKPRKMVIVANSMIKKTLTEDKSLPGHAIVTVQKEQKGTANALRCALPSLKGFGKGTILVANGDSPLLTPSTLRKFVSRHRRAGNSISMLSFMSSNPFGYGRILRDARGKALGVVEEKDATAEEKLIYEVNSGVYAIDAGALGLTAKIRKNAKKGEFYLTDIVSLAIKSGLGVGVYPIGDEDEFLGVNSRRELLVAYEAMRSRIVDSLMEKGVTFIDSYSSYVGPDVKIAPDTVIYPNVFIHGKTTIGKGCTIFPNARIVDSTLKNGVIIKDACLIEGSVVETDAQVGPMAHLRPLSVIGRGARVGNFVETKKTTIGKGAKAMHLSYLGDATVGQEANIGAGTITCNYDGKSKFPTSIGNRAFIGSDTQLVAPVTIGDGAYVGAGSTITKDVEPGALAVSRKKQKNYPRRSSGKNKG